jgi:glycosyltransferase involved in cell wall biosynthesis
MNKLPITVIVLTKNEQLAIANCLDSVKNFGQILVIDSNSTDQTNQIVKSYGCVTINFDWNGKYPKKKQWSLELSEIENDWVLFLDADERVSRELEFEIENLVNDNSLYEYSAIEIPLSYFFMGKELFHGHKVRKIALLNRKFCFFPVFDDLHVTNMWEVEGHYQPSYSGKLLRLKSKIVHEDPDGLYEYFGRHNRYSDWESELQTNKNNSKNVRLNRTLQGRIFDRIPFKPFIFFIYSFGIRAGWKDGRAGLNYALALSFYYWQISVKVQERRHHAQFGKV